MECENNEPLSTFVSSETFKDSMLHVWLELIVPLTDAMTRLRTIVSEQNKTLESLSERSSINKIALRTEGGGTPRRGSVSYSSPRRARRLECIDGDDDELVEAPAIFDFSRKTDNLSNSFNRSTKSFGSASIYSEGDITRSKLHSRLSAGNSFSPSGERYSLHPISPNVKNKMEENFVPEKQKFKIDGAAWEAAIESEIKHSSTSSDNSSIPVLKRMRKLAKRKAFEAERIEEEHSEQEGYKGKRYSSIASRLEEN